RLVLSFLVLLFFFSSRRRHTRSKRDWSSDVCSSDLALRAAGEAELIPQRSACELREAWTLAWQIRRSLFLWKGREGEVLPSDRNELRALARLIDGDEGTAIELEERYLRVTRRARAVAEQIIFEADD